MCYLNTENKFNENNFILGADFDTSQIDPLFKKRLDNYW